MVDDRILGVQTEFEGKAEDSIRLGQCRPILASRAGNENLLGGGGGKRYKNRIYDKTKAYPSSIVLTFKAGYFQTKAIN